MIFLKVFESSFLGSFERLYCLMVRMRGLEPPRLAAPDPKSFFHTFSYFLISFQILIKYYTQGF